ncbi:MAG: TIR domain-containing protein, partial [Candidatus Lokiarchaeota archaeon]|nr:TIR domain-containing protein [Candidatus Lokiarchaeota archaeon]
MSKVFISHSWEDNEISRKIAENLKRDGAEIWIDYARIHGGDSLPARISEALE